MFFLQFWGKRFSMHENWVMNLSNRFLDERPLLGSLGTHRCSTLAFYVTGHSHVCTGRLISARLCVCRCTALPASLLIVSVLSVAVLTFYLIYLSLLCPWIFTCFSFVKTILHLVGFFPLVCLTSNSLISALGTVIVSTLF